MRIIQNLFGEIDRNIEVHTRYSKEPLHIELDCYDIIPLFKAIQKSGRVNFLQRKDEKSSWRPVDTVSETNDPAIVIWQTLVDPKTTDEELVRYANKFHVLMRDTKLYSLTFEKGSDAYDRYPKVYPIVFNLE